MGISRKILPTRPKTPPRAVILEKVCKYLYYKAKYTDATGEIPEFKIEPEIALELLMAADFMEVGGSGQDIRLFTDSSFDDEVLSFVKHTLIIGTAPETCS